MATETIVDVPTSELAAAIQDYAADGYQIETISQGAGLWTIKARKGGDSEPPPGGDRGPQDDSDDASSSSTAAKILRGDGSFRFTAEVVGNDIVVRGVTSTWFGGPDDPSDNGLTASGVSTRANPDILGCALPMDNSNSPKTEGSPIPHLPWNTPVRVTSQKTGISRVFPVIDLGPSKAAPSHAAIDLTKAAFSALGESPSAGVMRVDYVIIGGARFAQLGSIGAVSIGQSEDSEAHRLEPLDTDHGMSHDVMKPSVRFVESPNQSSRNGVKIDMVVMHFTDGSSSQGAVNRFLNPHERVSAHYIIERDGSIIQMVRDSDKAWHAKDANARSIGIEHVAVEGQKMSPQQEASSVALLRFLMATYGIKRSRIVGHRFAPGNEGTTDCPHSLFGAQTKQAVVDWVKARFPTEGA